MVGENGHVSEPRLTVMRDQSATLTFETENADTISPSILQNFSAPVSLNSNLTPADHLRLMAHDPNAFNRWESGQTIARNLLGPMAKSIEAGRLPQTNPALGQYVFALRQTLTDPSFNHAFKALALTPPTESEITQTLNQSDPIAVHWARKWIQRALGDGLRDDLIKTYHDLTDTGPFSPSADAAGKRALRNRCLALLADRQDPEAAPLAMQQLNSAKTMTNEIAALLALIRLGGRRVDQLLDNFYDKWKDNPLVVDKWFMIAASRPHRHPTQHVEDLIVHKAFDPRNPKSGSGFDRRICDE